jgi:hypothetical protein
MRILTVTVLFVIAILLVAFAGGVSLFSDDLEKLFSNSHVQPVSEVYSNSGRYMLQDARKLTSSPVPEAGFNSVDQTAVTTGVDIPPSDAGVVVDVVEPTEQIRFMHVGDDVDALAEAGVIVTPAHVGSSSVSASVPE